MSSKLETQRFNFEIQTATAIHLDGIVRLSQTSGLNVWNKTDYEKELLNPIALMLIATDSSKTLGFVFARLIKPAVEILNIAVSPESRRRGVGKALLEKVLETAEENGFTESWLEVRESNLSGLDFYLSRNFKVVGHRKNYYSNPVENAILMTLIFSDYCPKK